MPGIRLSEELGQDAEGGGDHQEEDPEDDHRAGAGVHHLRAVGSVAVGPPERAPGQGVEQAQEVRALLAVSSVAVQDALDQGQAVRGSRGGKVDADDLAHVGGQEHDRRAQQLQGLDHAQLSGGLELEFQAQHPVWVVGAANDKDADDGQADDQSETDPPFGQDAKQGQAQHND